jgi:hypothetical protein
MNPWHRLLAVLCLLGGLCCHQPASAQLTSLETANLRLLFNEFTQTFLAAHVARCFENALAFYQGHFDYAPSEKVTLFLDDAMDYNNAAAWSSPRNTLWVQIAPTSRVYETAPSNERINHTLNHELAHIAMQDQAAGSDVFWRRLFSGKVAQIPEHPETILYAYLTQPRRLSPQWYHEGAAVFLETWMAGGLGRAQGPYDEMVFRAMVRDGAHFYDPIGLQSEGTRVDFQAGVNAYLYGTRFVNYLAYTYGPESVIEWFAVRSGDRKYYTARFRQIYGRSVDEAWREWISWEHAFQSACLDSIRRHPVTPHRDLTRRELGSVSRAFIDRERDCLYVAVNYPGVAGHIAAIDLKSGSNRRLVDVNGSALYFVTSLAYDPDGDALFYTGHNYEWRDLYRLDLATGKSRRLLTDVRIGDLVVDHADHSLWGIRHFNGISSLVRIPPPYEEWSLVYSPPYGQVIYDIDLSPDGTLLAFSFSEISGRQSLRMARVDDLLAGRFEPEALHDFGYSQPANFVFDPDGAYLYGSSYYTGISNIWRYDLTTGAMDPVTNCETGMFRPVAVGGDSLIAFNYRGSGFLPVAVRSKPLSEMSAVPFLGYLIAEEHPVVHQWNVGSPLRIDLAERIDYQGPYRGLANVGVTSVYPVVQGYKDELAIGLAAHLSDPGYVHRFDIDMTYSPGTDLPENERLHARLQYGRGPWSIDLKHNAADFYDLFGPLKTSRKGQSLAFTHRSELVRDRPRHLGLTLRTAGYINLERLPYAQNIDATYDRLWLTAASLDYQQKTASIGAVDAEKGFGWRVNLVNNYADGRSFLLGWLEAEVGTPFLAHHSSLWLRGAAGYSPGDPDVSFANFFFGGFQNNWVDYRGIRRYREYHAFPGIGINEIGGTDFGRLMLEWNLPPLVFKRYGWSWYYLTWLRPALFTTGLITNLNRSDYSTRAVNIGGQVDLRFVLLSRLDMTLSVGYARAFVESQPGRDEFMASLKILR